MSHHERVALSLMVFLLTALVFHPLLGGTAYESRFFNIILVTGALLGCRKLSSTSGHGRATLYLGTSGLLLNLGALGYPLSYHLSVAGHALLVCFYGYCATTLVHHILFSHGRRVRRETIYESICAYLLLGFFWGTLYSFLEHLFPGSFHLDPALHEAPLNWSDLIYHSFVTLTTLGYGDLVPVAPVARSLTLLESVTGVFYGTALVARLVTLYTPNHEESSEEAYGKV